MATYRTTVEVGNHTIWIEADTPEELIQEMHFWRDLAKGAEREDAYLFYRKAGKFEYYGFRRRKDGAEVAFGKLSDPPNERHQLFAYGKNSENYKGFVKYNPDEKSKK